jgi:hypothetical protein
MNLTLLVSVGCVVVRVPRELITLASHLPIFLGFGLGDPKQGLFGILPELIGL